MPANRQITLAPATHQSSARTAARAASARSRAASRSFAMCAMPASGASVSMVPTEANSAAAISCPRIGDNTCLSGPGVAAATADVLMKSDYPDVGDNYLHDYKLNLELVALP